MYYTRSIKCMLTHYVCWEIYSIIIIYYCRGYLLLSSSSSSMPSEWCRLLTSIVSGQYPPISPICPRPTPAPPHCIYSVILISWWKYLSIPVASSSSWFRVHPSTWVRSMIKEISKMLGMQKFAISRFLKYCWHCQEEQLCGGRIVNLLQEESVC